MKKILITATVQSHVCQFHKPIMKALKEIGYSGPYTLETHCLYPDDDIMLKDFADHNFKCLQYLQRLMNK